MTLLATFQLLLARCSGQDDLTVGTPIANRTHSQLEGLIGFFVNTLVCEPTSQAIPTSSKYSNGYAKSAWVPTHIRTCPLNIWWELHPERDLSRSPLFQVLFGLQINGNTHP